MGYADGGRASQESARATLGWSRSSAARIGVERSVGTSLPQLLAKLVELRCWFILAAEPRGLGRVLLLSRLPQRPQPGLGPRGERRKHLHSLWFGLATPGWPSRALRGFALLCCASLLRRRCESQCVYVHHTAAPRRYARRRAPKQAACSCAGGSECQPRLLPARAAQQIAVRLFRGAGLLERENISFQ